MKLFLVPLLFAATVAAQEAPVCKPEAVIDLATEEGVHTVKGQWRYSDVKIVETDFLTAGADGQPGAMPVKTYEIAPHAGGVEFDDSKWQAIEPTTLGKRRGNGRLSFAWYRITITIPEGVDRTATKGCTAVFSTSIDDYAEIWADGELARAVGQSGGSIIKGWNAENRLVVGRNVKPGQRIQLAIFGANGPLSNPPTNYIWMRYAKLEFIKEERGPVAIVPSEVNVEVIRNYPSLDAIVPLNAKIWKLADGFTFTEGPVWVPDASLFAGPGAREATGFLLFSDPNENRIYKFVPKGNEAGELTVFRDKSGYDGADIADYGQPGSNGLTLDNEGRLTINQHGNRRVIRLEKRGESTVLAEKYEGKRLNSPNDLVYRSDGALYFTDPPFGLPKFFDDPRKELPFSGVFCVKNGKLKLVSKELSGPNGLAFSPDEKYFYVDNWEDKRKVILRYEVAADGTLSNSKVFFDMTSAGGEDALDGMKVDQKGNLYVSGPRGLWIFSPDGKHLGTIIASKHPHNLAWGDEDGKSLYLCARSGLYRMRLNIPGVRP